MLGEVFEFSASDVLNNPAQEMVDGVSAVERGEALRITWWLEPSVYELTTIPEGNNLRVHLHFGEHFESKHRELVGTVLVQREDFLTVLSRSNVRFSSFRVADPHWPEVLDGRLG